MYVDYRYQVNFFAEMGMKAVVVLLIATSATSGLNIELKIENDPQCKFEGQQCSADLRQIIYCSAKGGSSFMVSECESGTSCQNDSGVYICLKKENPNRPNTSVGNNTAFICQGKESYPDPSRCNTAYICESAGNFPEIICECPSDSALIFSPDMTCTTNGSLKNFCMCPTTNRCKDGVRFGDFKNCHMGYFYLCRSDSSGGIVPDVHKCPPGQHFFEGKCQKPTLSIQSTEQSGDSPVCKKYHPPCLNEYNVRCSKKGELLPHRKLDRCYYLCDSNLKPVVKDCGIGSYFTCKYGQCGCIFGPKS